MIDRDGLAELEQAMGLDAAEILEGLHSSMRREIGELSVALAAGDLAELARIAHALRNDALMVRAEELLPELARLEQAARYEERDGADRSTAAVLAAWPAVDRRLDELGGP